MKKIILAALCATLILSGCITTQIKSNPTPTAPTAGEYARLLLTGETPEPPENPAGAVFIIPDYWLLAQPTATPTAEPKKGRSNYDLPSKSNPRSGAERDQ
jgi:hypothetical protein